MIHILSLDVSTKTGYCVSSFSRSTIPTILEYGVFTDDERVKISDFCNFDRKSVFSIIESGQLLCSKVLSLIQKYDVDKVVIEQTNHLSKNRFSQKVLEWYHLQLILCLDKASLFPYFIDTSSWRSISGCIMNKQDRKNNKLVKQKRKRGKITSKHVAVRRVFELYGIDLKQGENDIADAILMGVAFNEKLKSMD